MLITSFTTALILANIRKQFDDPLINIDAYIVPPNGLHYVRITKFVSNPKVPY